MIWFSQSFVRTNQRDVLTSVRPASFLPPGGRARYRSGCSCTILSNPAPCRVFVCTIIRKQIRCPSLLGEER